MDAGPVEEFIKALNDSVAGGTFVKLTLGKRRGGDDPTLKNVYVRAVEIKGEPRLSFTYRHETRDLVKNFPPDEAAAALRELLGAVFLSGHLFTTRQDFRLEFNRKREPRLTRANPTFSEAPQATHDRRKRRLVRPESSAYLRALGVTNERGEVRAASSDKFRQINKFVEIVAGLFESSPLAARKQLSVVDMGSGKGYLTFAVYDYFRNTLGLDARVTGVEARADLVDLCNRVAREVGFDGLTFTRGLIRDYEVERADILIALHACDTATDEALYKGVASDASIIIAAPCCHKELRPQIKPPEVLAPALRHGIQLERQAEMLTDTLRALLLEGSGYRTRVFEFISTEHTRKNTMIAAVMADGAGVGASAARQFGELKKFYGVESQRLERLLDEGSPRGQS